MRVPLSWLREYVDLPDAVTGRDLADRLVRAGLEVETVEVHGAGLSGPIRVGQVLRIEELTGFKKPIRFCEVNAGEGQARGIVCGAVNFAPGDKVVVALPGAVLPGGFAISARQTYGRTSEGMICSEAELGAGDDHGGILVLPRDAEVGADAVELMGLRDEVLDIAVTPDRGYCLSLRGVAREAATAYGLPLRDPALLDVPARNASGYQVVVEDEACDVFAARVVRGIDRLRPSPLWLTRRIQLAGMRPISLIVDVTNYVMLELGQPLHAYDADLLSGPITVRRALPGERLTTLDGTTRALDPEDLVIADLSGAIGLAGVMGGATTEISEVTQDVVLEAAHFDPVAVARGSRRHRISSEASKRFERGVDPLAARVAAHRAVVLLTLLGGGEATEGITEVGGAHTPAAIRMAADHPSRVAGTAYPRDAVVHRLQEVGCAVEGIDELTVTPPSWRPDLTDPADLAEEVIRLEGYTRVPSALPQVPPGRGYTKDQRLRRRAGQALAGAGYVEVLCYPFVGPAAWDAMGLAADDPRRAALRLVNPLADTEPYLRTTLLPGLFAALRRNIGRGMRDVALFESGLVFHPQADAPPAPRLPVDRAPSRAELAALEAALPDQPRYVAAALAGDRLPAGWWGPGRPVGWADAVEAARTLARAADLELEVRQGSVAPWHPGRCAELLRGGDVVGYAGELHPRVVAAFGLPERTAAMELDFVRLVQDAPDIVPAPRISAYPPATLDVALVVDAKVPAADVAAALREGAGELLEDLELFDVYSGAQIGEGRRSLAYRMRFRADDRTLTVEETTAARDAGVAAAATRVGAALRGA